MVDLVYLAEVIRTSGMKKKFLAEKMGISCQSLDRKLKGETVFTVPEMNSLSEALHLKNPIRTKIFFNKKVG